uniref:Reverse transcriptase domain-containing protein n=1 Tax=Steinernema glaseri TaxID=37863 RepID=A0A1I7Z7A9_9BILA
MPPGIAIFQRLMDQLTAYLPLCAAYLDDLVSYSRRTQSSPSRNKN